MKRTNVFAAASISCVLAFSLVGCSSAASSGAASGNASASSAASVAAPSASVTVPAGEGLEAYDLEYSKRDLDPSYDETSATKVDLSAAGAEVVIDAEGTYVLSGSMKGCVVVEVGKEAKVQLVLAGVNITNEAGPCIYVKEADKCFITLADGTVNTLTDGANYVLEEGEDEPNAALFSKEDLTINGSGTLNVTGNYRHAVRSKDDLVITGGVFAINAVEDGLSGKDCLKICDGVFVVNAGEDALKSSNDSEEGRGFVAIDGGSFTINAGDDAIHAETLLRITDGDVDIQSSYEGLEGYEIRLDGGNVRVNASDDGVNATDGSGNTAMGPGGRPGMEGGASNSGIIIRISGGTLYVNAEGDGIDSNGSIEMTGGLVVVEGPTTSGDGAFDYDGTATVSGGTAILVGAAGMAQSFSGGTQAFGFANVNGSAGQEVELLDASGKVVASFTATKSFQTAVITAAGAQEGDTLSVKVGGASTEVPVSTTATMGAGGPGAMGQGGMGQGAMGHGGRGEMPLDGPADSSISGGPGGFGGPAKR